MNLVDHLQAALALVTNPHPRKIREFLAGLCPSLADVSPYLREPGVFPYGWKTMFRTQYMQVSVLNWARNKVCPPHNHGASWGLVHVLKGIAHHAIYSVAKEGVPVLHKEKTEKQGAFMFLPRGVVHAMGNAADEALVTLNIYAPPIQEMTVYDLEKCAACIVGGRRCGAYWPTESQQIVRLIQLERRIDDARFNPDSPSPAQPGISASHGVRSLVSG